MEIKSANNYNNWNGPYTYKELKRENLNNNDLVWYPALKLFRINEYFLYVFI
jgi:hypothetical protein